MSKRNLFIVLTAFKNTEIKAEHEWKIELYQHQCISQFQLRPAPTPRATAGHLPALSVPGVGHLPTPGPFPSFWHARGFLSEYNYAEDFTGKETLAHLSRTESCQGMFLILCGISSLLIKPELNTAKSRAIDVNQRFLVIESNFCWHYLKKSFHIYKTIHNI